MNDVDADVDVLSKCLKRLRNQQSVKSRLRKKNFLSRFFLIIISYSESLTERKKEEEQENLKKKVQQMLVDVFFFYSFAISHNRKIDCLWQENFSSFPPLLFSLFHFTM